MGRESATGLERPKKCQVEMEGTRRRLGVDLRPTLPAFLSRAVEARRGGWERARGRRE